MNEKKSLNFSFLNSMKQYFKFDAYQTIFKKEIIGGLSTFLAMAYILAVNPGMVSNSILNPNLVENGNIIFENNNASIYQGGLFLATAISSFIGTMFMGLYARIPVALAPGMGLNAFFTYTISYQVGFESALSITILSGILYFLVAITPMREKVAKLLPTNLKLSIGVAIGFFIAYLGLQNSQIIIKDSSSSLVSKLGDFSQPLVIVALVLLAVALILHYAKIQGSIVITMLLGAVILIPMVIAGVPGTKGFEINPIKIGYKGFDSFDNVIRAGWVGFANVEMWKSPITYIGVLSFLYMDFFDTTGTLVAIDRTIDLTKNDEKWLKKANLVDALSTIGGAGIGATTVTSFVESTVGVVAGGKTGFSAIITSLCFGLTIALWPMLQIFMPISGFQPITGPILVLIGTMMISQIRHFEWEIAIDVPTLFITIIIMTLSNSIAYGIAFGAIVFVVLNASLGVMQLLFKKNKKIVNTIEIPMSEDGIKIKTREFYYLKRINWSLLVVSLISIIYIILQTGITYLGWF